MNKIINQFEGEEEKGIRYTMHVGYEATKENKHTIKQFNDLSKEFDGVRVSTLRYLLDVYENSWKFDELQRQMVSLQDRLAAVELVLMEQLDKQKESENKPVRKGITTFADRKEV